MQTKLPVSFFRVNAVSLESSLAQKWYASRNKQHSQLIFLLLKTRWTDFVSRDSPIRPINSRRKTIIATRDRNKETQTNSRYDSLVGADKPRAIGTRVRPACASAKIRDKLHIGLLKRSLWYENPSVSSLNAKAKSLKKEKNGTN